VEITTLLAQTGDVPELMEELLKPVWNREQSLELIYPLTDEIKPEAMALGYEITRSQEAMLANQQKMEWEERVPVVYSPSMARKARRGLSQRLDNAEQAILALTPPKGRGKRQQRNLSILQSSVDSILKKYCVEGLVEVSYICEEEQRSIRKYKDRKGKVKVNLAGKWEIWSIHSTQAEGPLSQGSVCASSGLCLHALQESCLRKCPNSCLNIRIMSLTAKPNIDNIYQKRSDTQKGVMGW